MNNEQATLPQFLAALEWVASSRSLLGHQVATICQEPVGEMSAGFRGAIRSILWTMDRQGVIPVFAAGNLGPLSSPLSVEFGVSVGATDRHGNEAAGNGPRVDLLAPGEHLLCLQPKTTLLNSLFVGQRSGSSYAAAIVAGAIAGIAGRKHVSAATALEALRATARNKFIDIDAALRAL